jgi:hypothetical protein
VLAVFGLVPFTELLKLIQYRLLSEFRVVPLFIVAIVGINVVLNPFE